MDFVVVVVVVVVFAVVVVFFFVDFYVHFFLKGEGTYESGFRIYFYILYTRKQSCSSIIFIYRYHDQHISNNLLSNMRPN